MSTRSITVAVVAAAAALAVGGGTALAMGAGGEQTASPAPAAAVSPAAPAPPTTEQLRPAGPVVDRPDAERNALRAAGGGVVTDVERDDRDDDGDPAKWEIDVRNGDVEHEIDIDARTGEVLDHDIDDLRDGDDDSDD